LVLVCGLGSGLLAGLSACSPALDWRDVPVTDELVLQFPCRPDRVERTVVLSGRDVRARMLSCDAADMGWSATLFDVGDPTLLPVALRHLRHQLALHLRASESAGRLASQRGLTPQQEAWRMRLIGQDQAGRPVHAEVLIAARGLQALQIVALTRSDAVSRGSDHAAEFIDSLRPAR
jgi:hypothetical protein